MHRAAARTAVVRMQLGTVGRPVRWIARQLVNSIRCTDLVQIGRRGPAACAIELGGLTLLGDHETSAPRDGPVDRFALGVAAVERRSIGDIVGGDHLSLIHISEPTRLLSISYAVFC